MKKRVEELTHFLSNECKKTLEISKTLHISESDFQRFHKLPEKNFNKKFKEIEISEENELKKVRNKFYISLTSVYLKQGF